MQNILVAIISVINGNGIDNNEKSKNSIKDSSRNCDRNRRGLLCVYLRAAGGVKWTKMNISKNS